MLLELCDRIMVINSGAITGVVDARNTTKEEIGLMMTGTLNIVNKEGKTDGIAKDSAFTDEEGKA